MAKSNLKLLGLATKVADRSAVLDVLKELAKEGKSVRHCEAALGSKYLITFNAKFVVL